MPVATPFRWAGAGRLTRQTLSTRPADHAIRALSRWSVLAHPTLLAPPNAITAEFGIHAESPRLLGNDPAFGKLKIMHGCLTPQPAATAVRTHRAIEIRGIAPNTPDQMDSQLVEKYLVGIQVPSEVDSETENSDSATAVKDQ